MKNFWFTLRTCLLLACVFFHVQYLKLSVWILKNVYHLWRRFVCKRDSVRRRIRWNISNWRMLCDIISYTHPRIRQAVYYYTPDCKSFDETLEHIGCIKHDLTSPHVSAGKFRYRLALLHEKYFYLFKMGAFDNYADSCRYYRFTRRANRMAEHTPKWVIQSVKLYYALKSWMKMFSSRQEEYHQHAYIYQ